MDVRKKSKFFGITVLVVSVLALTACKNRENIEDPSAEANAPPKSFSCYATNEQGERLEGFQSEKDGKWYLFVPSTQDTEELTLHYEGDIDEVPEVTMMQSNLPSVQISLNGTTLEEVHQDKNVKYGGNSFVLTDPGGKYDLAIESGMEIKGRGNSTWTLCDKKAYQIKFNDKISVMGMGQAKKWLLLANAADDSLMRNQLVYRMAEKLDMEFVPSFKYVDLWIDGEYLGNYLLGEKVEIGESRLNLAQPDGVLLEHDEGFYEEEEHWFYSDFMRKHFTVKEINEENPAVIAKAMDTFHTSVDTLMKYLQTTPSKEITLASLSERIDVDSFAKYYLINEFVLNREAFVSSFYWYQNGPKDILHLGPIWDFDTCMGNDGADPGVGHGEEHTLFTYLLAVPEFQARVAELYDEYKDIFASMIKDSVVLKEQIKESAAMNYLRWNVLGKPNPKTPEEYFGNTFDAAVSATQQWISNRVQDFTIAETIAVNSKVSDDCRSVELFMESDEPYENVVFAVWNLDSENNMVMWNSAAQMDGIWHSTVDLTDFDAAGMYQIDVYANDQSILCTTGCVYVPEATKPLYQLEVQLSDDNSQMLITLKNLAPCTDVRFAVWSVQDGQDDIQWFESKRTGHGKWETTVDMSLYQRNGKYCIHAYDNRVDGLDMLDETTINVEKIN